MDKIDPTRRSVNMRAIKSRDTKPEMRVRRLAHLLGYRFRLHRRDLPGKPDLAFISKRKAIFVHGCFWHQHENCKDGRMPASNRDYWVPKLTRNVERDRANIAAMENTGWRILTIWECETEDLDTLATKLENFLKVE